MPEVREDRPLVLQALRMPIHSDARRDTLRAFNTWCLEAIRATEAFEATDLFHAPSLIVANEALYAKVADTTTAVVWTCRATDHPYEGFLATLDRLFAALRAQPALRRCRLVLASPDDLGDPRVRGVEVVDARAWLETWHLQHRSPEGVAARLCRLLRQRRPVRRSAQRSTLIADVFRYCLSPEWHLPPPRTMPLAKRPDIVFTPAPGATHDQTHGPVRHVIVEVTDQTRWVSPGTVRRLASYVDTWGVSAIGILATHAPLSAAATSAMQRQALHQPLYAVDDAVMLAMVRARCAQATGDVSRNAWSVLEAARAS